jgi:hypothetical protein
MPKTKTSLKSKKQPRRIKRTLSWLKPTTPAKGLLLFAIVFALAGGGYYLYKSRAASYTVYPGGQIQPASGAPGWGATVSQDCNGNKGCVKVMKLAPNSEARGYIYVSAPFNRSVFLCVTARAQVSSTLAAPAFSLITYNTPINGETPVADQGGFITFNPLPQSTTYKEFCSLLTLKAGSGNVWFDLTGAPAGSYSDVYVTNVTMKW